MLSDYPNKHESMIESKIKKHIGQDKAGLIKKIKSQLKDEIYDLKHGLGAFPGFQQTLIPEFIRKNQYKINKIVDQNAIIPSNWKANSILVLFGVHWVVCIALFSVLIHSTVHSQLRNVFIIMLTFSLAMFIIISSLAFGVLQGYLHWWFIYSLFSLLVVTYGLCLRALQDQLKSVKAVFDPPNSVKSLVEYTQLQQERQKMCDAAVYLFTIGMYVTICILILRIFYGIFSLVE